MRERCNGACDRAAEREGLTQMLDRAAHEEPRRDTCGRGRVAEGEVDCGDLR